MSRSGPLQPDAVAALLGVTVPLLCAETTALPEPVLSWHPAPAEWCVKEVVGHLIEAERRGFSGRIRVILDRDEPQLEAWDQAAVARQRRDCEKEMGALLADLAALRAAAVAMVGGLTREDLRRGGQHPKVGHLRVVDLLHEWIHHDCNHLRQIFANVQSFVWPSMGNAQRFSVP